MCSPDMGRPESGCTPMCTRGPRSLSIPSLDLSALSEDFLKRERQTPLSFEERGISQTIIIFEKRSHKIALIF